MGGGTGSTGGAAGFSPAWPRAPQPTGDRRPGRSGVSCGCRPPPVGLPPRRDGPMERLLLIGCPALMAPDEGRDEGDAGHRLRRLGAVADALTEICPWIDAVRPGVLALPLRGPARYFGGDDAVADRVAEIVTATLEESPPPTRPTD